MMMVVEIVVPIEFALGASPDQGRSGSVRAGRQLVGAGFRITFNDDGSIGDGLRSTLQWPVSISGSGILISKH